MVAGEEEIELLEMEVELLEMEHRLQVRGTVKVAVAGEEEIK